MTGWTAVHKQKGEMMESWVQTLITIVCSVAASSGFWAYIMKKSDGSDATKKMLLGLGHDRIIYLGMHYLERGNWITQEEYENLSEYLYKPYVELGGNGSAKRIMEEVGKLTICKIPIIKGGTTYAQQNEQRMAKSCGD